MITTRINTLTKVEQSIVNTLLYFDVFNYPLKREEVFENCSINLTEQEFNNSLDQLVENKNIQQQNGFYFVNGINQKAIEKRIKANALAERKLKEAYGYSKRIAKFPFVKGVCISGGLSKKYYDEKSDIDYFIVTKANRLWLCRTFFTLYYKTLPKKKREYFCLNYYISESDLKIPDENYFVAMELAHLIPTVNYQSYQAILTNNVWYKNHLPNKKQATHDSCFSEQQSVLKKMNEKFFYGKIGNWLDDKILSITLKHWRKKHSELKQEDFNLQLRSKKHVCKHHIKGHQNKVLELWEEKINQLNNGN